MKKLVKRLLFCLVLATMFWLGALVADRQTLDDALIRLHVVANSDTEADQRIKLQVRDAILSSIGQSLSEATSREAAYAYLKENLPKIQSIANTVLEQAGVEPSAVVSLCKESFDTRIYDSFMLPAGVYDALRITIGEGAGHNWWCVAFPSLWETGPDQFVDDAVEAGLSSQLSHAMAGEPEYEVRFFLLEALGKLENMLHAE